MNRLEMKALNEQITAVVGAVKASLDLAAELGIPDAVAKLTSSVYEGFRARGFIHEDSMRLTLAVINKSNLPTN